MSRPIVRGSASLIAIIVVLVLVLGAAALWVSGRLTPASAFTFSAAPASGVKPLNVTFTVTGIPHDAYGSYVVDFGNGSTFRVKNLPSSSLCVGAGDTAPYYCKGTMLVKGSYPYAGTYTASVKNASGTVLQSATVTVY